VGGFRLNGGGWGGVLTRGLSCGGGGGGGNSSIEKSKFKCQVSVKIG